MTPPPIHLRTVTVSDVPSLTRFFRAAYSARHITTRKAHLLWQFKNHFARPRKLSARIVLSAGKIVGFLGTVPVGIYLQGRTVRGAWLANWIVRKEARGMGAGSRLLTSCERGFALASGFSDQAYPIYIRHGWKAISSYTRLVYILDPKKTKALIASFSTHEGKVAKRPQVSSMSHVCRRRTGVVASWGKPPAPREWDRAWRVMRATYGGTTDRTYAYLQWRFFTHPFIRYHVGVVYTNALKRRSSRGGVVDRRLEICGLVVARLETAGDGLRPLHFTIGRIVDIVSLPSFERAVAEEAFHYLQERGCDALDTYLTYTPLIRAFRATGFAPDSAEAVRDLPELYNPPALRPRTIQKRVILAHMNERLRKGLPSAGAWHIVKADGDRDRAF